MRLDTLQQVETPEGITLTLRSAGFVPRCLAFLIDLAARAVIWLIAAMVLGRFDGVGVALLLLLVFALEWFYPVVFELSRLAATPGKRALGLRVVMDDGMPVTAAASLLRNLLRAADFLPLVYAFGVLSMLWRADFKRLGDIVAGTRVVHERELGLHGDLQPAPPLAPPLALTPAQQTAIVDWALRTPRLTAARAEELAAIAAPLWAADAVRRPEAAQSAATRLMGVAHWALGRR
jgi:uncharacterized RDD family membrane protein YckC